MKKIFFTSLILFSCFNLPAQTEQVIGYTYYDLQTNGSISNCIVNNQDGTISTTWTDSPNSNPGFPLCGIGYCYYDSSAWNITGTQAGNSWGGFPSIAVTSSGKEIIISENNFVGSMLLTIRPVKGFGAWTENPFVLNPGPNHDARAKVIACHDTVYAIWNGSGNGGVPLHGQNGPILFSRSTDGGITWPILRAPIPPIDSNYYFGFDADSYSIDARAGVVAISYGQMATDIGILKSWDGGLNWTNIIAARFPVPFFDPATMNTNFHGTGNPVDTMKWGSGDSHVLVDHNGICHIFWSEMIWWNDSLTGGGILPYQSDRIYYWNETMPTDSFIAIASAVDANGNGIIDFPVPVDTTCELMGPYGGGLTQMPSAGIDANGTLYVTYQSVCEACDTNAYHQIRKHVYLIASDNNGLTWTAPYDLVPSIAQGGDGEEQEAVFACIAKTVDSNAYIIYQRDPAPGTALNTANACESANNNGASDIIATIFPTSTIINGLHQVKSDEPLVSQNFPNPAHGSTTIKTVFNKSEDIEIRVCDLLGNLIYTETNKQVCAGQHLFTLNTFGLKAGIYFYTLRTGTHSVTNKMIIN